MIDDYFSDLLHNAIVRTTRTKTFHMWSSWALHIGAMVLGGAATVVLGLHLQHGNDIALVLSALATFVSGLITFWGVDKFWLERRLLLTQLQILSQSFEFARAANPNMTPSQVQPYFDDYARILTQDIDYWEGVLSNLASIVRGDLELINVSA